MPGSSRSRRARTPPTGRSTSSSRAAPSPPSAPALRPAGRRGRGGRRGSLDHPGLWDQHVHLAQWTLASQRLDLAGARSPEDALRAVAERVAEYPELPVIGWGHRSGGWDRDVTVSELDAVSGGHPGRADQWRRPPRLAQHHGADAPGDAGPRLRGPRGRVVLGVLPALHAGRRRRHLAGGVPPHARPRGVDGRGRDRRLRVQRRGRRVGRALGERLRPCCASGWRPTPTPSRTSSPRGCAPATRCPAATAAPRWGR